MVEQLKNDLRDRPQKIRLADNPTASAFVRYWANSGRWSARALNG
jgi:hypothetical protein